MEKKVIDIPFKYKELNFNQLLVEFGYDGWIPTDSFIDKVRPGIGATTCEILAPRNSIIIEPNVSVEEVKKSIYQDKLCIVKDHILCISGILSMPVRSKLFSRQYGFVAGLLPLREYQILVAPLFLPCQ